MLLIGEGVGKAVCSGQGVEVGEHEPIREAWSGTLKFEAAFVKNLRGKIEVSRKPAWAAGKNLGMRGQEKQEKKGKILRHAGDLVAWRGCGIKLNRVGYHFRPELSYWSISVAVQVSAPPYSLYSLSNLFTELKHVSRLNNSSHIFH